MKKTLQVSTNTANYPITIGKDLLHNKIINDFCGKFNRRIAIITDDHLYETLGKQLLQILKADYADVELLVFKAGEQHKTRETKQHLEDELCNLQYGRDSCLIALGGGVVTDMVGFLAATFCRGVPVIYVPTTLLAMVDAAIGGKTAVNTPYGKNLIGTFAQPQAVFIDIETLNTLPKTALQNGMAEIIKHALIADSVLFKQLSECNAIASNDWINIIYQNCLIKAGIVAQDEKECGLRQVLNFGHTIGHVIETALDYQISHGAAVALGMLIESYISALCGFLDRKERDAIFAICAQYEINFASFCIAHPQLVAALAKLLENTARFKHYLVHDKKTLKAKPRFVLLDAIGRCHVDAESFAVPVEENVLQAALAWARAQLPC